MSRPDVALRCRGGPQGSIGDLYRDGVLRILIHPCYSRVFPVEVGIPPPVSLSRDSSSRPTRVCLSACVSLTSLGTVRSEQVRWKTREGLTLGRWLGSGVRGGGPMCPSHCQWRSDRGTGIGRGLERGVVVRCAPCQFWSQVRAGRRRLCEGEVPPTVVRLFDGPIGDPGVSVET